MNKINFDFITPPAIAVVIDGQEITVRPITMRALPAVLSCVEPVLTELMTLANDPSPELAVHLLAQHGQVLSTAVALCTGLPADQVDDMTPDRVAALLLVCAEINVDFFGRAVSSFKAQASQAAPLLTAKLGKPQTTAPSSGPTPSDT